MFACPIHNAKIKLLEFLVVVDFHMPLEINAQRIKRIHVITNFVFFLILDLFVLHIVHDRYGVLK